MHQGEKLEAPQEETDIFGLDIHQRNTAFSVSRKYQIYEKLLRIPNRRLNFIVGNWAEFELAGRIMTKNWIFTTF